MVAENALHSAQDAVIEAALAHVPFDGWSDATLKAALADSGVDAALAGALFPRGPLDLALAYHRRGDARMVAALAAMEMQGMRFRDRVAAAVMARLDLVEDKELVRRGTTFFALPQNAPKAPKPSGAPPMRSGPRLAISPRMPTGIRSAPRSRRSIPRRCCSGWAMTARTMPRRAPFSTAASTI